MRRSIESYQRLTRMIALKVDGTGTASLSGIDASQATLTDNGTGDYTITFAEPFGAADFSVAVTPITSNVFPYIFAQTVNSVRIKMLGAGSTTAGVAATGTLDLTADITLTQSTKSAEQNGNTFNLQIEAAAANPSATVLAVFTGSQEATVLTITPNNGTNNGGTPVGLTTAEVAELINNGSVAGKTVTLTDSSKLRKYVTAAGGGATAVANGGEGDNVTATFVLGADPVVTAPYAIDADFHVLIIGSDITDRY